MNDSPDLELMVSPLELPALAADKGAAVLVSVDGEIEEIAAHDALLRLAGGQALVCHHVFTARRLMIRAGLKKPPSSLSLLPVDVLELFGFVRPGQFVVPSPQGLAGYFGLSAPEDAASAAALIHKVARMLLKELSDPVFPGRGLIGRMAQTMAAAGWPWGEVVCRALGAPINPAKIQGKIQGNAFAVWEKLGEWEEAAPPPRPGSKALDERQVIARLEQLTGADAESRPGQHDFALAAAGAFVPRNSQDHGAVVLAEASTGIGKTLGYVAPASVWAEQNKGVVWLSTYTRNLQRQLDQELSRLYPDPAEKKRKAVIRKGRENYVCLLNFQEFTTRPGASPVLMGLLARWLQVSRDGDMVGGDFPSWLTVLTQTTGLGNGVAPVSAQGLGLTDRRGECIYNACTHYRKCFIEKAVRKARRARLVVANHALVMVQAATDYTMNGAGNGAGASADASIPDASVPGSEEAVEFSQHKRLVFDEGHHVFDAADAAFSVHLSGLEMSELRRWLRGPEGRTKGRGRGLAERLEDMVAEDETAKTALKNAVSSARVLPGPGWMGRLKHAAPQGAGERFLSLVRQQIVARNELAGPYSLETECLPLVSDLQAAADDLGAGLGALRRPLVALAKTLRQLLDKHSETLDTASRNRFESSAKGLEKRVLMLLRPWTEMLASLGKPVPEEFADWFELDRAGGREMNVAMCRHWVDPTLPFAQSVLNAADGVLITSATLRDSSPDMPDDWRSAEIRTGAAHLIEPPQRSSHVSAFDYEANTLVFVVNDVARNDLVQISAAYRELIKAAGGGALGLFTAISRLRVVHEHIHAPLERAGFPLYAQHVDAMDTGTLVDMFRLEENACLLGTDAVRDGVDVPGRSLRLLIFDRVPWPRPDILQKARKAQLGGARYEDMLTRLRLKQAFGRLIRTQKDRGVFVILDNRMPSRLLPAFPPGAPVRRVGLKTCIEDVRAFLAEDSGEGA